MLPEWTWEQWQWKGTSHSSKFKHYRNLTIRLFSVISRTLVEGGGLTSLQRSSWCILQSQPTGQIIIICRCQFCKKVALQNSTYTRVDLCFLFPFLLPFFYDGVKNFWLEIFTKCQFRIRRLKTATIYCSWIFFFSLFRFTNDVHIIAWI